MEEEHEAIGGWLIVNSRPLSTLLLDFSTVTADDMFRVLVERSMSQATAQLKPLQ
jgi:hypothetical protein